MGLITTSALAGVVAMPAPAITANAAGANRIFESLRMVLLLSSARLGAGIGEASPRCGVCFAKRAGIMDCPRSRPPRQRLFGHCNYAGRPKAPFAPAPAITVS